MTCHNWTKIQIALRIGELLELIFVSDLLGIKIATSDSLLKRQKKLTQNPLKRISPFGLTKIRDFVKVNHYILFKIQKF
jgi:hypothetical protein